MGLEEKNQIITISCFDQINSDLIFDDIKDPSIIILTCVSAMGAFNVWLNSRFEISLQIRFNIYFAAGT